MIQYLITNFFFLLGAIIFSFAVPLFIFKFLKKSGNKTEAKKEIRYVVLKCSDMQHALTYDELHELDTICRKIDLYRDANGKKALECVVVESDWPEYEPTWKSILARS